MSHVINDVLEDCINWYYLNCNCTKLIKDTVLEDCINWYYLNLLIAKAYANGFLRIVLIGII